MGFWGTRDAGEVSAGLNGGARGNDRKRRGVLVYNVKTLKLRILPFLSAIEPGNVTMSYTVS